MKAFVLAAGRGERMRPLTDRAPKPLLPVSGRPLIDYQIERLRAAGIVDLVVNLAWLGEQIAQALGDGSRLGVRIAYSREPAGALETAGGIRQALALLGNEPFVVVNGDVFTDFPYARLLERTPPTGCQAHVVLVDNPPHNPAGDFSLVDGRAVRGGECGHALTYSGIAVFEPSFFAHLPPGERAPLAPLLFEAADQGRLGAERYGGLWVDVGTPERLAEVSRLIDSGAPSAPGVEDPG